MSEMPKAHKLRIEVCLEKAAECRKLARRAPTQGHQIMMEHIAETWERIAADIDSWLVKK